MPRKRRILLIDDDQDTVALLTKKLRALGLEVVASEDPASGCAAINTFRVMGPLCLNMCNAQPRQAGR